ncbi:type I restriction-modification system, specificity subunit S HsdS [Psychroflexus torquis ATCC 700755]|uniref:Type I restriction-modification system, specificity subunit S HsdS n=1 Tax=Psychroflexus torquis (strain ATCC 700755 / CIP 106069 / ACAM 623) TaxID=313595 RepID=K4IKQ3_PSYTT|nr:restriction endonuclease subunit S [Psychroflexus torquis]AFU69671.1 type I restriction-modification system, specificity subunit S HsdS [Psychroflexus torquis ATCC 700755]
MIKYDTYKDSGIEWLGEIPVHWEVKRVKEIFNLVRGKFTHRPRNDQRMYNNGTFPFLQTGDVAKSSKYVLQYKQVLNENGIKVSRQFKKGTLVMTIAANIGDVALLGFDAYFPDSLVAFNTKHNINFYYYLLSVTKSELDTVKITNTQDNLNLERLNSLLKICPPLSEQTIIANYLDKKTTAIDQKINLLTKKTDKYKELRKSLINQTVTDGLDKNTIWKTYRLKDIGQIYSGLSGKNGDDFKKEKDPNNRGFIPFTNIANNTYLDVEHLSKVIISPTENQNKVQKNDLFFLMSSEGYEDIGKSAVLKEDIPETYLNSFCKGFRITNTNVDAFFINYLLLSDDNRNKMVIQGKGFTRINLKIEKVNNFSITIPSTKAEQTAIANYLDEKTSTIDAIVSNIERQINHLKELRKTVINDVVTGKIKVI